MAGMLMPSLLCLALLTATPDAAASAPSPTQAVNAVLEDWHQAAARADEARYFSHFTPDAVFLGTDGSERWTREEFRVWAKPFFAKGKTWSFTPSSRHVSFSPDGKVAWFDEALATPNLGPARGTGVLVKEGAEWKIAQYSISIPIPNELMKEVKERIEARGAKPAGH